ncbi:unnamed protein product [Trichogramma brassicae]|uniref:Uncharacterized protein n=1 Tax=Trichogramma brassicae TaxID=86971 RepID=A0A6H5IMP0_9HYME|nr:unnamed protein product [Trichogramma brassicae]
MSRFLSLKLLATVGSKSRAVTKFRAAAATGAESNLVRHFSLGQALEMNLVKPKSVDYRIHKPPEWDPNDPSHNNPRAGPSIAVVTRLRRVKRADRNLDAVERMGAILEYKDVLQVMHDTNYNIYSTPSQLSITTGRIYYHVSEGIGNLVDRMSALQPSRRRASSSNGRPTICLYFSVLILSGCGDLDGTNVPEAINTMMHISRHNIKPTLYAPTGNQSFVVDHISKVADLNRNAYRRMRDESARMTIKGSVLLLHNLEVKDHLGLIIPGGNGIGRPPLLLLQTKNKTTCLSHKLSFYFFKLLGIGPVSFETEDNDDRLVVASSRLDLLENLAIMFGSLLLYGWGIASAYARINLNRGQDERHRSDRAIEIFGQFFTACNLLKFFTCHSKFRFKQNFVSRSLASSGSKSNLKKLNYNHFYVDCMRINGIKH